MSWRANGGYLGPRPTGPSASVASGWWDSRSQFRSRRDSLWPSNGDPFWSDVSLLLHMDGSNGSTTFTDSSTNSFSVTAFGNAQISTAQAQFGQSGLFDGNGDYVSIPTSSLLNFGTAGDFAVEMWIRPTSLPGNFGASFYCGAGPTNGSLMIASIDGDVRVGRSFVAWDLTTSTNVLATGQWQHIAVCRAAGTLRIFVGGVEQASQVNTQNYGSAGGSMVVGARQSVTGQSSVSHFYNGHIDDLRVTRGARFTAAFTPPAAAFPDGP